MSRFLTRTVLGSGQLPGGATPTPTPTLPNLSAAIAAVRAGTGRAIWAIPGSSITQGYRPSHAPGLKSEAFPQQMRALWVADGVPCRADAQWGFQSASPNGGSIADFATYNPAFSFTGTPFISTQPGVGGDYLQYTGVGDAVTFAPTLAANRFEVWVNKFSGAGTLVVTDASGTLATIVCNSATVGLVKVTVSRAASNTNPITITMSSGSAAVVGAIVPYDTTAPMLEIWAMGHSGASSADWLVATNPYDPLPFLELAVQQAHLVMIELGTNDFVQGASASTFQTNETALATAVAGSGRDLILVKPHKAKAGQSDTATLNLPSSFLSAIDAVSTAKGLQPAIDMNGGITLVDADYDDTIHLVASGNAKLAVIVHSRVAAGI